MKKKQKVLLTMMTILIIAITAIIGIKTHLEANLKQLEDLPIKNIDLTKLEDGTYTGSYNVFPVAAEVRVTISNCKITRIELLKHSNGQGAPAEIIPEKVVEAQTMDVDIVSGATYSSKVILKAIENALNSKDK